jgi:hypothetical protein
VSTPRNLTCKENARKRGGDIYCGRQSTHEARLGPAGGALKSLGGLPAWVVEVATRASVADLGHGGLRFIMSTMVSVYLHTADTLQRYDVITDLQCSGSHGQGSVRR